MEAPWRTLRGRLALASVAGLVAASLVFALVSSSLVSSLSERNARDQFDRETSRVTALASAQIERAASGGGCRTYSPAELAAFVGPGTRVYATGLKTCPGTDEAPFKLAPPALAKAVDRHVLATQPFVRIPPEAIPGPGDQVATAATLRIGNTSFGELIIVKPRDAVRATVADTAPRLVAAAVIGLIPAVLLTLLLTTRLTRPIRGMRDATDRVAAGDMSVTVARTGTSDLDALADDFNIMVARLQQRDAQSRDFLMKVTHDLRTPLTAIRGHAAALADGVVPPEMRERSLQTIETEAQRLEHMVADLLDLARMEARRFRVSVVPVDAAELVRQAVAAHEAVALRRDVALSQRIGDEGEVHSDPDRLRQIIGNLVDNAVRWTPPGGTVQVDADVSATDGLRVEVRDDGPGVPPERRDQVFAPFESSETPDGRTGTGLGLAICRQLARALGGDVTVHDAPGGGAAFVLTLPPRAPETDIT